jgi:hypothetical protein
MYMEIIYISIVLGGVLRHNMLITGLKIVSLFLLPARYLEVCF